MDEFEIIDNLVLNGGLEFAGTDPKTGEVLYKTTDKLKDLDAKLSDDLSAYFSEISIKLWEKGFLDMDITVADPLVKLGPKSFSQEAIDSLEKNERVVVEEIIKVLYNKK
jgi:hypothetical protein